MTSTSARPSAASSVTSHAPEEPIVSHSQYIGWQDGDCLNMSSNNSEMY